ncbi:MAG: sulfatase-like hydrolase/transferase [Kofleriaceae bacterium]
MPAPARPVGEVLGAGVIAGLIAGLAAGAIDALWSWEPAAQFVPGVLGRIRFTLFAGTLHAATGAALGLVLAALLLALSRASRLGDITRHALARHAELQARDPGGATAGLSMVLAGLPCVAITLYVAFRFAVPYITGRKELNLAVIVVMLAVVVALVVAVPITFLLARGIEHGLAALARRIPAIGTPIAPVIAGGVLATLGLAALLALNWDTAQLLPLRAPAVVALGLVLAVAALRPGWYLAVKLRELPRKVQIAAWAALPLALVAGTLAFGGSAGVVKATTAYSGLGSPIARTLRRAFDWDGDGYSRFLGGGDCDDGDRTIHPGALEIPDDGIDQNCVGGDAVTKRAAEDYGFVPLPPGVPADARVLLITIDTTRADHLGMYGYARKTSPNLDALAKDGTVFEHGWAHAPSTRYSIPAILTGRLPLDVRYDTSIEGWPGLALKAKTIAESLTELGFTSGAITNYWYFDKVRHMDQGFAEYDNANASRHQGVAGAGPEQTRGSSSKEQTDKAIAFVERNVDKRWLLWVHYYDPHYAYEPHPEAHFGPDKQALYDGELLYTDLHIGRLLDSLRAQGLYDKTIVVVTGDHGEGFGEHGIDLHGYHLYAPQTKVPLVIRVPGIPGRRSTTPAGHVDILPTLVNLAGGKPDPEMMGRSLLGPITGTDTDRVVFQQLSYEGKHEMRAGVDRTCHVIYNVSPDTSWEVYRVDRDPGETEDLAGDSDECETTRAAVEHWYDLEQVPAGATEALLAARPAIAAPLDADFDRSVRLLACEAPAEVKPGDAVTLTWTFEALATVDLGWKLFVHVEAPAPAKSYLNGDHAPARPFEWWKPGQFIRYSTTITVPRSAARGRYTVRVGMFAGSKRATATAPRAQVTDNAVACTTFEVVP